MVRRRDAEDLRSYAGQIYQTRYVQEGRPSQGREDLQRFGEGPRGPRKQVVKTLLVAIFFAFVGFNSGWYSYKFHSQMLKHEGLAWRMGYAAGVYDMADSFDLPMKDTICPHEDSNIEHQKELPDFDASGNLTSLQKGMREYCALLKDHQLTRPDGPAPFRSGPITKN